MVIRCRAAVLPSFALGECWSNERMSRGATAKRCAEPLRHFACFRGAWYAARCSSILPVWFAASASEISRQHCCLFLACSSLIEGPCNSCLCCCDALVHQRCLTDALHLDDRAFLIVRSPLRGERTIKTKSLCLFVCSPTDQTSRQNCYGRYSSSSTAFGTLESIKGFGPPPPTR